MTSINFQPYEAYQELLSQLDEFSSLSQYSYGLAQQLLFKYPKDTVRPAFTPRPSWKQLSFGMGDQQFKKVNLACEWITFEEYAEREKTPTTEIASTAADGRLGPVREKPDGTKILLWPPKYHGMGESTWPEVGKKKFTVIFEVSARAPHTADLSDVESFDETQRVYLQLAHALGEPAKVAERAGELLNRSLFLLEWIAFEVFLRSTIQELIRRHPHVLAAGKRGKENVSLEEIVKLSKGLSDIALLRESLATREIERQEHGGESVHGLLNLLKSQFKFNSDPYAAWYVLNGTRTSTSYKELLEFKDTRNVLVHDAGRASTEFQGTYPGVPVRDGVVVIEDEFYLRARLALRSIAFHVAGTICSGEYVV
jgi:hypothetical protein